MTNSIKKIGLTIGLLAFTLTACGGGGGGGGTTSGGTNPPVNPPTTGGGTTPPTTGGGGGTTPPTPPAPTTPQLAQTFLNDISIPTTATNVATSSSTTSARQIRRSTNSDNLTSVRLGTTNYTFTSAPVSSPRQHLISMNNDLLITQLATATYGGTADFTALFTGTDLDDASNRDFDEVDLFISNQGASTTSGQIPSASVRYEGDYNVVSPTGSNAFTSGIDTGTFTLEADFTTSAASNAFSGTAMSGTTQSGTFSGGSIGRTGTLSFNNLNFVGSGSLGTFTLSGDFLGTGATEIIGSGRSATGSLFGFVADGGTPFTPTLPPPLINHIEGLPMVSAGATTSAPTGIRGINRASASSVVVAGTTYTFASPTGRGYVVGENSDNNNQLLVINTQGTTNAQTTTTGFTTAFTGTNVDGTGSGNQRIQFVDLIDYTGGLALTTITTAPTAASVNYTGNYLVGRVATGSNAFETGINRGTFDLDVDFSTNFVPNGFTGTTRNQNGDITGRFPGAGELDKLTNRVDLNFDFEGEGDLGNIDITLVGEFYGNNAQEIVASGRTNAAVSGSHIVMGMVGSRSSP